MVYSKFRILFVPSINRDFFFRRTNCALEVACCTIACLICLSNLFSLFKFVRENIKTVKTDASVSCLLNLSRCASSSSSSWDNRMKTHNVYYTSPAIHPSSWGRSAFIRRIGWLIKISASCFFFLLSSNVARLAH